MASYAIFGGAGGVGSALARSLTSNGHEVHLIGRTEDSLSELAEEIGASYAVADATDSDAVEKAIGQGPEALDGMAYAVGTIDLKPMRRVTAEDMRHAFDVNVIGALNAARASRERMGKDSAMVLFSSVAAQKGFQNHTAIASAKGALEALTRQLAAEYAPKTRVNAIALSLTDTPLASSVLKSDAMRDGIAKSHALQRLGQPEDPAALARFLLSDESSWMTGTILNVDGGRTALA
ncbi:SDR family NAD(P)-dependent oxidoreductase [Oceanicaulis sp. MMSF_3324]|uniref:SDR family NAD(P)-dependent oxidoreductase n=1 Tax=Oceanicaulis sp. MMSF_3324 TaxID=3046702 RepID=UPI00273F0C1E|nr:SDR family oxidoreductase [Oceanicaulis sp. MMSF_3324]